MFRIKKNRIIKKLKNYCILIILFVKLNVKRSILFEIRKFRFC